MGRPSLSMVGSCVRGSRQRKRALARPVLSSSGRTALLAPARSNGLLLAFLAWRHEEATLLEFAEEAITDTVLLIACLLYTSDAADDLLCVDLGGRRIIKKKKK